MRRSTLFLLVLLFLTTAASAAEPPVDVSVQVRCGQHCGSGVPFNNAGHVFVWTAAHVVRTSQVVEVAIEPSTGKPRVYIRYRDVTVRQDLLEEGRQVGQVDYLARVIRYSDPERGGHDLALLELHSRKASFPSVKWYGRTTPPKAGTALWVVGGAGAEANHTVATGVFARAGKLLSFGRPDVLEAPLVYDQITVPALPGCSGGGVFLKNGECIGLLTNGIGPAEAFNFIVPTRRLREYAAQSECQWAISTKVALPVDVASPERVTDRPVSLPTAP